MSKPCLLDVNALVGLLWNVHSLHNRAHTWFARETPLILGCALTELSFVRVSMADKTIAAGFADAELALAQFTVGLGRRYRFIEKMPPRLLAPRAGNSVAQGGERPLSLRTGRRPWRPPCHARLRHQTPGGLVDCLTPLSAALCRLVGIEAKVRQRLIGHFQASSLCSTASCCDSDSAIPVSALYRSLQSWRASERASFVAKRLTMSL